MIALSVRVPEPAPKMRRNDGVDLRQWNVRPTDSLRHIHRDIRLLGAIGNTAGAC